MSNIVVLSGTIKVPVIETIITKENLFLRVLLPDALGADHVKVFLDNSTLRIEADLPTGTSRYLRSFRLDSETDVKTLSCTYDKEILTIKLQVHSALGDDYIRNLTSPFDDDLLKGPHNDTTGGIPQIILTEHKTSEVVKNTSVFPLLKARGVQIKTLSGLYLRACRITGTVSVVNNAGSWELWLAERINGPTKYAFRSYHGKYLTACVGDEGIRADRDIALAWEVWTIQKLNDGTMTFMSEHNEYLGFEEVTGVVRATHVMPNEHSKWIIEEIDNFNDSVI